MTLHLTYLTSRFVLQVSDRLVTKAGSPHDPLANKNLLVMFRDAVVTVGYAGLAYLDSVPTDQWLAESLWGEPFPPGPEPGRVPMFIAGGTGRWPDIGYARRKLQTELEAAFRRLPSSLRSEPLIIVLAGWQWNRKVQRPISLVIRNSADPGLFEVDPLPRYWHYQRKRPGALPSVLDYSPEGYLRRPEAEELVRELNGKPSDDAEGRMVEAIRSVARREATVGANCMSILIPATPDVPMRARYIPVTPNPWALSVGSAREYPASFSPWIIGPGGVNSPSVFSGSGWAINLGSFQVKLEALEFGTANPSTMVMRSLKRLREG